MEKSYFLVLPTPRTRCINDAVDSGVEAMRAEDPRYGVVANIAGVDRAEESESTTRISGAHRRISRGTASPVLVTDGNWRIVTLNPEAERLLGYSSSEAKDRPCNALLYGRDQFGNHIPPGQCDVGLMVRRSERVHPFEFDVLSASGSMIRTACSVIVLHDGPECRIVHILTPISSAIEGKAASSKTPIADARTAASSPNGAQRYTLTAREYQVLRMLANGADCHHIADALFISLPTVRNHVHNFLRKMDVHSQVEAVSLAYREGLI